MHKRNQHTVAAVADAYLRRHPFPTRRSRDAQERSLRRPLAALGDLRAEDLTHKHLLRYCEERKQVVREATVKRELGALEAALRFGQRMGLVKQVPPFPRLRDRTVRVRYLTAEQRRIFEERLARAPLHIRGFGMLALVFGARAGAILDLTADRVGDHIDFRVPGEAETRKRRSVNRVPERLRALLAELVLASSDGRLFPRDTARRFTGWCARQDWPEGFPPVTPHVLRHTCATLMLEKGATVWEVSRWLNESVATIERHYGHFTADSQQRLAALAMEKG